MSQDLQLAAVGLSCPLGSTFLESINAYAASRVALRRYPPLVGPDGRPPTLACVVHPLRCDHYDERLWLLLTQALEDCGRCWSMQDARADPSSIAFPTFVLLPTHLKETEADEVFRSCLMSSLLGPSVVKIAYGDSASGMTLLLDVHTRISEGLLPGALVCAVDSLIDPGVLDHLYARGHGLFHGNPYGFVPGEGAAVLLLLPSGLADAPVGRILRVLARQELAEGPNVAKRRAMINLLRELPAPDKVRVHADLCGPRWRAEEFGAAIAAIGGPLSRAAADLEVAALQTGYMGAADAICRLVLALGDPPWPPSPGNNTDYSLVIAMSDSGGRAGAVLKRFSGGSRARDS